MPSFFPLQVRPRVTRRPNPSAACGEGPPHSGFPAYAEIRTSANWAMVVDARFQVPLRTAGSEFGGCRDRLNPYRHHQGSAWNHPQG